MPASLFRSLSHALRGLRLCFASERNFRIHTAIGLLAVSASFALPLLLWQRVVVWFVVVLVLVLELINSSIERVVDLVKPQLHEHARDIKDLMAGAVLLVSLFAAFIGLIMFLPSALLALRAV